MRQEQTIGDVAALLRAKNTLLWVVSREELRVERGLIATAAALKMDVRFWDCADGITNGVGETIEAANDPLEALKYVERRRERALYVFRDLHKWFDPQVLRSVRSIARKLQSAPKGESRAIVLLTPSSEVPPELAGATVLDWPLPDREEIATILDGMVESLDDELRASVLPKNGARDAAIDAAVGLTADEAANSYALSLARERAIDPAVVSAEKRRVIARERVLTWHDPDPRGLDAVGGLDVLKQWLVDRKAAFSPQAREYGLPAPKGMLLVGPPGTGKSLTAKTVATAWGQPLLQLDLGALKSKWVGESEANIRKALAVAETVAPCILWIDEIEKALAGSTGPQGDGGVGADALGSILSWMQERAGSVFVIATANDVSALPPELLRKGRFDELWFVDLPNDVERAEVIAAALRQYGRDPDVVLAGAATIDGYDANMASLVTQTDRFTGAEIAALVPDALFTAFADGARELHVLDLLVAAESVTPLASTAKEKLDELREWAQGRARKASSPSRSKTSKRGGRSIEL